MRIFSHRYAYANEYKHVILGILALKMVFKQYFIINNIIMIRQQAMPI